MLREPWARHVFYFIGSLLNSDDLERVCATKSKMTFVLCNINSSKPDKLLANAGWQLRSEEWLEHLTLPGGTELADRWLAKGSPYRRAMGAIKAEVLTELRRSLNSLGDSGLRLPMRHQLIQGERNTP